MTEKSARNRPDDWVRAEIRALKSYHVPDSTGLIKLDAMENPHLWPRAMVEEWLKTLEGVALNRYPDPQARRLKDSLRRVMGIPDNAALLLGNGSDEIIQMLALAVGGPGRTLLAPEPSFVMFRMIASLTGTAYCGVPLKANDFALDADAMLAAISRHQPSLIFLANPNNPTGQCFDEAAMRAVIEAAPGLVVVDEAYYPFTDSNCLGWLDRYDHLLVMRTVSKLGLAGLRLGLIVGGTAWLDELDKTRLPYNVGVLTQASAEFALAHADVLQAQATDIRTERGRLAQALSLLPGLTVYPSEANFILFRTAAGRTDAIHAALKASGILIKNLNGSHPMLADCLRVTVGSAAENRAFLQALETVNL